MQYLNFQSIFGFTINKKLLFSLLLIILSILILSDVFANSTPTEDPIGTRLCAILKILMGPTAKAIATIAIIFVAIGLFAGRMTWLTVIPIIIGIIIIFSAPAMVKFIGGNSETECTATVT